MTDRLPIHRSTDPAWGSYDPNTGMFSCVMVPVAAEPPAPTSRCHAATGERERCSSKSTTAIAIGDSLVDVCQLHAEVHELYLDMHGSTAAFARIAYGDTPTKPSVRPSS